MDQANFAPTISSSLSLEQRRQYHAFTAAEKSINGTDHYPPHLDLSLKPMTIGERGGVQDANLSPFSIFNRVQLLQIFVLLKSVVPAKFEPEP